jgi:glyoxylase-like metal-dependent hydrolase (beta-lactamase superfamily II)
MIVLPFVLGPIGNNTYLAGDPVTGAAVVIDPSFEPAPVLEEAGRRDWQIQSIWLTHAHFDHIGGTAALRKALGEEIPVAINPLDLPLWREDGGARMFGFPFSVGEVPQMMLKHGQKLALGGEEFEVRHTPGHSPGHVVFYAAHAGLVFCGDLIFYRSVGRTDLPEASSMQLAHSIQTQIYTLPPETRLLPGHGPETTVGEEVSENPYV